MLLGLLLAAVGVAIGIGAWRWWDEPRLPPNVVVLLADTLRADHLSGHGYERPTSPNMDAFFHDGVVFRRARAQASCTYPSVNSILASRYPAVFLNQPEKRMGIPAGMPTLAEILRRHGYATIALSASPIVRKTGTKYNNHGGFDAGFNVFDEQCMWREARCLIEKLLPYLDVAGEPFFAYLHYMDPHDPYRPPPWYRRRYSAAYEGLDFVAAGNPNPIADAIQWQKLMPEYQPRDLQHLIDLYDDEITYFDGDFAVLMGDLASRGVLERTIVVLVADHGEQFLEHGYMKHCNTLFDTDIHTPLSFRLPGVAAMELFEPVQNVDAVPTILDYAGIDPSEYEFDGRSLRRLIEGRQDGDPSYAFAMQGARRSVADERYKLRYNARRKEFQLHDLARDPQELFDVLDENPETFVRLQPILHGWETKVAAGASAEELAKIGEEVQERLRALGYLH
jgi:arylsulfatase A-like enzyme